MHAILTGDIIHSRKGDINDWMPILKNVLQKYGKEPKEWEIFRGDSFQLKLAPEKALLAAFHLKASIKQSKWQDVRIGIGLGKINHDTEKITESNGSAFVFSGECFEALKKQTLAIKSTAENLDKSINLMLSLGLLSANSWSSTVAEVIKTVLENPEKQQTEIARLLNKSQSSISEALKRGGFEEIMQLNDFYIQEIQKL